ncbi:pilus assembly FimT family protein [Tundrisphaera sp. TA3]|uniref:pilus assembly FimT family protein n=1 Tax=Tundrisphaera sp. TA3 TaxID=3435775 RepID=UPI003EC00DBF
MTTRTKPKGGYALVELLVVMTLLAILLGLCVGTLHLLMRLDRSGQDAGAEASDLFRLARAFRADAHAARDPEPPAASAERFAFATADGRSVEYAARPGDILRTARQGDRIVGRDTFRRPPGGPVAFAVDRPEGSAPIVVLRIGRPPGGPGWGQAIEAEYGKDRRRSGSAQ